MHFTCSIACSACAQWKTRSNDQLGKESPDSVPCALAFFNHVGESSLRETKWKCIILVGTQENDAPMVVFRERKVGGTRTAFAKYDTNTRHHATKQIPACVERNTKHCFNLASIECNLWPAFLFAGGQQPASQDRHPAQRSAQAV